MEDYKVDSTEVEILTITDVEEKENKNDEYFETEITLTNKRLYIDTEFEDTKATSIIELESISYIRTVNEKTRKNYPSILMIGMLAIIAGIAVIMLKLIPISILLIAAGFIFILTALILNRAHYNSLLVIGTNSRPIEIDIKEININKIEQMQIAILQAKENNK